MQLLSPEHVSAWSVEPDEAKQAYIETVCSRRFGARLYGDGALARFHDFLCANSAYLHSAHFLRYLTTFDKMIAADLALDGQVILETGGASPVLDHLGADNVCHVTESDLRLEIDAPDGFADMVLSFEVLEHIKDQPEHTFEEVVLFQETGVKCFAQEIFRVLKPGGYLCLTTPNPCSAQALANLLDGIAPMVFRPHVREYTKAEIEALFSGFERIAYEAMYNFFLLGRDAPSQVGQFALLGADTADRGDDHFFCFRKPK